MLSKSRCREATDAEGVSSMFHGVTAMDVVEAHSWPRPHLYDGKMRKKNPRDFFLICLFELVSLVNILRL